MKPMAFTVLDNSRGEFGNAAIALRFNMKLTAQGNYAGWLTVEQVNELRDGGFAFRLVEFKFA